MKKQTVPVRLCVLPCPNGRPERRERILNTIAAAGFCPEEEAQLCLLWPEGAWLAGEDCLQTLCGHVGEDWDALIPVCRGERGWPVLLRRETAEKLPEDLLPEGVDTVLRELGCRRGFVPVEDWCCTCLARTEEDAAMMEIYGRVPYGGIPDEAACRALLAEAGTLPHIVRHCEKTAEVAVELAKCLSAGGYEMDIDLVRAGALLHDILRLTPPHALTGAKLLAERGYFDTAEVVRRHMDLEPGTEGKVNETSLVFFADKLAMEDRRVSLRRRHENSCMKTDSEEMRAYIWRRFEVARITEKAIAAALELGRDVL